jgi:hypothetical protein
MLVVSEPTDGTEDLGVDEILDLDLSLIYAHKAFPSNIMDVEWSRDCDPVTFGDNDNQDHNMQSISSLHILTDESHRHTNRPLHWTTPDNLHTFFCAGDVVGLTSSVVDLATLSAYAIETLSKDQQLSCDESSTKGRGMLLALP